MRRVAGVRELGERLALVYERLGLRASSGGVPELVALDLEMDDFDEVYRSRFFARSSTMISAMPQIAGSEPGGRITTRSKEVQLGGSLPG